MPSPNVTVAAGTTRRRRQPATTTTTITSPVLSPTVLKSSLITANATKAPKPTSKLRKPSVTGQYMRSTSPIRSPRPPPPPGIPPTGRGNARPARQPRTPNAPPAPSIRKSTLAQMREEYDELKRKNNEYVKKMARQEEELRRLKAQLLQKTKQGTATATTTMAKNRKHGDSGVGDTQAEMLQAKEKLIHEQDEELRKLRKQLEEKLSVQDLHADEPKEKEKEQETMLLEKLRMEKEIAARQLAEMAKELEELRRLQPVEKGVNNDKDSNDISQQLIAQLETQQLAHEESLKRYEADLAEKDKLLLERGEAIETLKNARDETLSRARTEHSKKILELKRQHDQEMKRMLKKLDNLESTGLAQDAAKLIDKEFQRILEEFEQEDCTPRPTQNETKDNVRPQDTRHVERSQSAHLIKTHQANWSSQYLPTQAISWPAPQPLSILKKTMGPKKTTPAERIASAAAGDYEPVLTPLDPKTVQVYISSVSGNSQVKHRQEQIQHLLRAHHAKYELVDVASSVSAFQYMKRANNNGSSEGRAKELPQLFVGGEYRGQFQDVLESAEDGTLDDMLRPAAERHWTPEERAALQKAEAAAAIATPPPVRVLPAGPVVLPTLRKTSTSSPGPVRPFRDTGDEDEDEALLRELEREIMTGKATAIDIADL